MGLIVTKFLILLLLLCCFSMSSVKGSVHEYTSEKFISKGNAFVFHGGSEGLYSSFTNKNETFTSSFIRFDKISFRRPEAGNLSAALIQAIVFEVEDRETIGGSAYGGQRAICCSPDLAKLGVCPPGEVIHRPSTKNAYWPQVLNIKFDGDDVLATMPSQSIQISETGMYNLYFMHCDTSLQDVVIVGKTIWKTPTGYLPGRMSPLMKFYGLMYFAFVILGIFWFSQYAMHLREVVQLQNCITVVITLGMLEMAFWYFEYAEFNETGVRPTGITVWAVTFGTVKRTVARLIILMVSMGYGVVKPTLGGLTSKVVMLGGTFLVASEVLELVENVGAISDFSGSARIFLVLPVAIFDAFFIVWIFTSLSTTLGKLQARRMMAKLEIYRKFTNALVVAVVLSIGGLFYELYFKANDVYNERWQTAWIIPAFWQFLSFSVLCVICTLWAPSQNLTRYAYSDEAGEEFDKEENLTLIKPSQVARDVPISQESRPIHIKNGSVDEEVDVGGNASARGSQSEEDSTNTTIFLGGLDPSITDEELRQPFSQHGEISSVKIPVGKSSGFVQFANRSNAEEALERLNWTAIGKQTVRLSWGRNPANKQMRGDVGNHWNGGGFYGGHVYDYGYGVAPPQDPTMYAAATAAYGAYPLYGTHQQQVS